MNFLAHLYLAGNDEGLLIGNFIADGIRGKELDKYPDPIKRGIILHRKIDTFTDSHPVVRQTVSKLRKSSGKYAPVVSDVIYDHFLASLWKEYSPVSLKDYAHEKYTFLTLHKDEMPENMQELLKYMIRQNWLVHYAELKGIAKTLKSMSKRVHFANNMATAILDLESDYTSFSEDFRLFFPDMIAFVEKEKRAIPS
jgi:acyl carrier protein phosphodiesterase